MSARCVREYCGAPAVWHVRTNFWGGGDWGFCDAHHGEAYTYAGRITYGICRHCESEVTA